MPKVIWPACDRAGFWTHSLAPKPMCILAYYQPFPHLDGDESRASALLTATIRWSLKLVLLAWTFISSMPGTNQDTALQLSVIWAQDEWIGSSSVFLHGIWICCWALASILPCPASLLPRRIRPFFLLPAFCCRQHPANFEYFFFFFFVTELPFPCPIRRIF